jgi:hypothetical protein
MGKVDKNILYVELLSIVYFMKKHKVTIETIKVLEIIKNTTQSLHR